MIIICIVTYTELILMQNALTYMPMHWKNSIRSIITNFQFAKCKQTSCHLKGTTEKGKWVKGGLGDWSAKTKISVFNSKTFFLFNKEHLPQYGDNDWARAQWQWQMPLNKILLELHKLRRTLLQCHHGHAGHNMNTAFIYLHTNSKGT